MNYLLHSSYCGIINNYQALICLNTIKAIYWQSRKPQISLFCIISFISQVFPSLLIKPIKFILFKKTKPYSMSKHQCSRICSVASIQDDINTPLLLFNRIKDVLKDIACHINFMPNHFFTYLKEYFWKILTFIHQNIIKTWLKVFVRNCIKRI